MSAGQVESAESTPDTETVAAALRAGSLQASGIVGGGLSLVFVCATDEPEE